MSALHQLILISLALVCFLVPGILSGGIPGPPGQICYEKREQWKELKAEALLALKGKNNPNGTCGPVSMFLLTHEWPWTFDSTTTGKCIRTFQVGCFIVRFARNQDGYEVLAHSTTPKRYYVQFNYGLFNTILQNGPKKVAFNSSNRTVHGPFTMSRRGDGDGDTSDIETGQFSIVISSMGKKVDIILKGKLGADVGSVSFSFFPNQDFETIQIKQVVSAADETTKERKLELCQDTINYVSSFYGIGEFAKPSYSEESCGFLVRVSPNAVTYHCDIFAIPAHNQPAGSLQQQQPQQPGCKEVAKGIPFKGYFEDFPRLITNGIGHFEVQSNASARRGASKFAVQEFLGEVWLTKTLEPDHAAMPYTAALI